jgi:hypothetical protein
VSGLLLLLEAVNTAEQIAKEVDETISFLSEAIHHIQVTDSFADVLDENQLEEVYCRALNLSAAVTEYIVIAIIFFTQKGIDCPTYADI